ncbi:MAG: Na(+)/H(+) antiporter subunit D [bacterium]
MMPPALIMIAGAFAIPLLPKKARSAAAVLIPAAALVYLWNLPEGTTITIQALGYTLQPLKVDALSRIFATIFALIATAGGIYAWHIRDTGQQVAALVYGGGAVGLAFSGDLFSLLFFTELMAVFSTCLVWARRTEETRRAGTRYLLMHLVGGSFLMGGILLHLGRTGSIAVAAMDPAFASSWIMLVGVAINGAIPPLHPWLPDAYPKATITGAVFMSAFTTKSSVYVLVRMFAGYDILIWFGVAMALYGVVYAVLANDIRGILAYHIISQVGYMVAGAGLGTEMAINGAVAHAFSHILYKGLLFMGAGAAIYTTGKSKLTELGGIYRHQKAIFWLYMIGAFSISGFPLFNGFISKSMVITGAGEAHHVTVMLLLLLASIGTFLHTGLKLPYWTWFGEDRGIEPRKAPVNMYIGMGVVAFLCTFFGIAPGVLYRYLPYPVHFEPYNLAHLVETTQILIFTFAGFWVLRWKLAGEAKLALDTDWVYRRPAPFLRRRVVELTDRFFIASERWGRQVAAAAAGILRNPAPGLQRLTGAPGPDRAGAGYDADDARPILGSAMVMILLAIVLFGLFSLL